MDRIVERHSLRETLARILKLHSRNESKKIQESLKEEKRKIQKKAVRLRDIPAWERVQLSRKADRPSGNDYIQALFPDFIELHGDQLAMEMIKQLQAALLISMECR